MKNRNADDYFSMKSKSNMGSRLGEIVCELSSHACVEACSGQKVVSCIFCIVSREPAEK